MTTNDEQYVPSDEDVRWHYAVKRMDDGATRTHAEQEYTRWLAARDARVRRDAWDACYHQMVTAPARGVIVTEKSNPYAPERRETPTRQETRHDDDR